MFDVDGTLIALQLHARPSKKVISAIAKANKKIHVGLATSRPYSVLKDISDDLQLSGPSIILGGVQIMDMVSKKVVWERPINLNDFKDIVNILKSFKVNFIYQDKDTDINFSDNSIVEKPLQIWVHATEDEPAEKIINDLTKISNIAVHKMVSWDLGKVDLTITHALATKQHGIFEVAKLLKIDTQDIIGVGDGYNDFPLLMACGLKVAMGNAVEDLKAIADYIAPPVEKDGAADVIEKFVLSK